MRNRRQGGFYQDLREGQQVEDLVADVIRSRNPGATIDFSDDGRYDIRAEMPLGAPSVTYEVKYDIRSAETNKVAFECFNGSKASGLMTTEADVWVVVLPDKHGNPAEVLFFSVEEVRGLVYGGSGERVIGGDKQKSMLILIKTRILKRYCKSRVRL